MKSLGDYHSYGYHNKKWSPHYESGSHHLMPSLIFSEQILQCKLWVLLPIILSMIRSLREKQDWFCATRMDADYISKFCAVFYCAKIASLKLMMRTSTFFYDIPPSTTTNTSTNSTELNCVLLCSCDITSWHALAFSYVNDVTMKDILHAWYKYSCISWCMCSSYVSYITSNSIYYY